MTRSFEMNRYLIIIEETGTGFSAFSPDLPGCVATGETRSEVEREMKMAIQFHIEACALKASPSRSLALRPPIARSVPEKVSWRSVEVGNGLPPGHESLDFAAQVL